MKTTTTLLSILTATLVILTAVSCSSSRGGAGSSSLPAGDLKTAVERLADNDGWQTVKIPVNVSVRKPLSAKIGGTLTMKRDEEIRLSLRFFGIEVASAMVTGDSVYAYAKMQKIYVAESLDNILSGFPATVGNLQDLLMARIFRAGSDNADIRGASVTPSPAGCSVEFPSPRAGLSYSFAVSGATQTLDCLDISYSGGHSASVTYTYPSDPARGLPSGISVSANVKKKQIEASLAYSAGKADWDTSSPGRFSIPAGYRRVSLSSLFKMLNNL